MEEFIKEIQLKVESKTNKNNVDAKINITIDIINLIEKKNRLRGTEIKDLIDLFEQQVHLFYLKKMKDEFD